MQYWFFQRNKIRNCKSPSPFIWISLSGNHLLFARWQTKGWKSTGNISSSTVYFMLVGYKELMITDGCPVCQKGCINKFHIKRGTEKTSTEQTTILNGHNLSELYKSECTFYKFTREKIILLCTSKPNF